MDQEPTSESNSTSDQLVQYFTEFDKACALIGSGQELFFIEEEATKEACSLVCQIANMNRMAYAVMRNNEHARREAAENQVGPQAFKPQREDWQNEN